MLYAKEVEMTESIQEGVEKGAVPPAQTIRFEPEVLAFCCEH